jgi:hypothetical protein
VPHIVIDLYAIMCYSLNHGKLPKSTLGLNPEQQQKAAELYSNASEKALAVQGIKHAIQARWEAEEVSSGSISTVATNRELVKDVWASHQAKSTLRKAAGHYKKNAAAYQEQALLEATQAGHDIDGWDKAS